MARITSEAQYEAINARMEQLLKLVSTKNPKPDDAMAELDVLSDLIEEYEIEHFPIIPPSIAEVLRYIMAEKNLSQKEVASLLGISSSRVSEYIKGKAEPTLKIARLICQKFDVSSDLVLGV